MRPLKRLTRSSAFQSLLCWVAANYIRLVYVTGRWREEGREPALQLTSKGEPYIAAFWHGRLLMAPTGWAAWVRLCCRKISAGCARTKPPVLS